jgi:hypothetical protein
VQEFLQITDVNQEHPRLDEVNGINFAKISFSGRTNSLPRNGFAFVAVENRQLLVIGGSDSVVNADSTLPPMDASVYTLEK